MCELDYKLWPRLCGKLAKSDGTLHPNSKLRLDQITFIRGQKVGGWGTGKLAKQFGVTPQTIRNILSGKSWKECEHDVVH